MFQILLQGAHVECCDACNLYVRPHSSTAHNLQIRHHTVDCQFISHCRLWLVTYKGNNWPRYRLYQHGMKGKILV